MGLSWQLAWRFRRSKNSNGFISFISASSTLGIALGCFVLILILSVMNGFENELKNRLLSLIPHGELTAVEVDGIANWKHEVSNFKEDARILSAEPFVKVTAMLQKAAKMKAVELTAIDTKSDHSNLRAMLTESDWQLFRDAPRGLLLGKGVMSQLNIKPGQQVQLLVPQVNKDLAIKAPKSVWLTAIAPISIGGEVDNHVGYMHMEYAADIVGVTHGAQGIQFRLKDAFQAPVVIRELGFNFDQYVYISDWTRTQGHLYQDIQLVRGIVLIALSLVIAVACFNIVSTLVMAVKEKQSEIAMLKTMGAENSLIIRTFMLQGVVNGVMGTAIGVLLGVLVAQNLSDIAVKIEQLLGVKFLSGDIYFIDFLPSQLNWNEVYLTTTIAMVMSVVATLYPAFQAAKVEPAKVLGH